MKIKIILTLIIMFISLKESIANDFSVSVRDTLIPRGNAYEIPIYGKISELNAQSLKITLNFNALVLDVRSARGGDQLGIKDASIALTTKFDSWDSVDLTLSSSNVRSGYDGILCYLLIEALTGPDTISQLKPTLLEVNNVKVDTDFAAGYIKTSPPTVSQKYIEGIGLLYPNPFSESAAMKFTIEKASKVDFYIYSGLGRLIQKIPESSKYINFEIFNNKNERIENPESVQFEPGNYTLILRPLKWEVSAGVYYMFMKTSSGEYNTQFIYVK